MSDGARSLAIIIIAVAVVIIFVPLLVASTLMGGMMSWWGGWATPGWHFGAWWIVGMMVFMLVFWGAIIAGIFLLVRWATQRSLPAPRPRADEALELLRHRYAAGEISREEFEERRRDLLSHQQ